MLDTYVLLAPLLVLPAVLLLAFVGCNEIFGLDPVDVDHGLVIVVGFHPPPMENLIPDIEIVDNGKTFQTIREGPFTLPNGDRQFKLSNIDVQPDSDPRLLTITCRLYKDGVGPPFIEPVSCEFELSLEATTAVFFVAENAGSLTITGCASAP